MEVSVDSYVFEVLMRDLTGHDDRASSFLVYLCFWYRTAATKAKSVRMSHRQLAEATGLSKRTVQTAIQHLVRRRLLRVERMSPTAVPAYSLLRPWVRRRRAS